MVHVGATHAIWGNYTQSPVGWGGGKRERGFLKFSIAHNFRCSVSIGIRPPPPTLSWQVTSTCQVSWKSYGCVARSYILPSDRTWYKKSWYSSWTHRSHPVVQHTSDGQTAQTTQWGIRAHLRWQVHWLMDSNKISKMFRLKKFNLPKRWWTWMKTFYQRPSVE